MDYRFDCRLPRDRRSGPAFTGARARRAADARSRRQLLDRDRRAGAVAHPRAACRAAAGAARFDIDRLCRRRHRRPVRGSRRQHLGGHDARVEPRQPSQDRPDHRSGIGPRDRAEPLGRCLGGHGRRRGRADCRCGRPAADARAHRRARARAARRSAGPSVGRHGPQPREVLQRPANGSVAVAAPVRAGVVTGVERRRPSLDLRRRAGAVSMAGRADHGGRDAARRPAKRRDLEPRRSQRPRVDRLRGRAARDGRRAGHRPPDRSRQHRHLQRHLRRRPGRHLARRHRRPRPLRRRGAAHAADRPLLAAGHHRGADRRDGILLAGHEHWNRACRSRRAGARVRRRCVEAAIQAVPAVGRNCRPAAGERRQPARHQNRRWQALVRHRPGHHRHRSADAAADARGRAGPGRTGDDRSARAQPGPDDEDSVGNPLAANRLRRRRSDLGDERQVPVSPRGFRPRPGSTPAGAGRPPTRISRRARIASTS